MLQGIEAIGGTGLFWAAGASPPFGRVTLIYGENGRGKSTLSAILRSCAEGDALQLRPRATLGQPQGQHATLRFDNGGNVQTAVLADGAWSQSAPELVVFDADFVARNVYAGGEITPDQRAHLLDFALGEEAVVARGNHDAQNALLQTASATLRGATQVLDQARGPLTLAAYRALPADPQADEKIAALQVRLNGSQAIEALRSRPIGTDLAEPTFQILDLFAILRASLPSVADDAEARVREHIAAHGDDSFENWLSTGQAYIDGDSCPFCTSSIRGNSLIAAYRAHFNTQYQQHKVKVEALERGLASRLSDGIVERLRQELLTSQAQQALWQDTVALQPVEFDSEAMRTEFAQLRALLQPLAQAKGRAPLDAVGSEAEETEATAIWTRLLDRIRTTNRQIEANRQAILAYRAGLAAESAAELRSSIATLEATKRRHSEVGISQIAAYDLAVAERDRLTAAKDLARSQLDGLMEETFRRYGATINELLMEFGTHLSVVDLGISYRGATSRPRTSFALQLRGHELALGESGTANFGNSLSEGDKRSLAFAFFIARLQNDPGLANKIVVIDDPMCSLDRTRRSTTVRRLKTMASECRQLIVLAHDAFFLRELDDSLAKLPVRSAIERGYVKIVPSGNWAAFDVLDLSLECREPYEQDLHLVLSFTQDPTSVDKRLVARSIRPLIEGFLHRRYPLDVPRHKPLGTVLNLITEATATSPLAGARPLVPALRDLNDYTTQFMHVEGAPPPDFSGIDDRELQTYCARALAIVQ